MMNSRRVHGYVAAEPFRPFRIKMTSGETFEVRHPEMIFVGKTTAHVHTWDANDETEREREISIILIESIETLGEPAQRR